ncbi:MAG: GGDEF domain-containing protein [Deltaproteobacteria bacterium]|nr:GGDEF domain-containing protein [Deltaproteobacteria bacterium]
MSAGGDGAGKPLFVEQAAERWLARWSDRGAFLVALAAVLAAGVLDHLAGEVLGYDFEATAVYILPIAFAAWAAGTGASVICALLATGVEGYISWLGGPQVSSWVGVVSVVSELLLFLGAAYTFSRLRWHLDFERHISRTDPLTGIGNPRAFEEVATRELNRLQRRPAPVSVAFFDLDDFKSVNDARGHAAGNRLLRAVGDTLRTAVRGSDFAARVGGDEFALLLPDTDAETCRAVVERLRVRLREAVIAEGFGTTFSIGAVTFADPPAGSDQLLAAADRAMYVVKHGAKDGVRYEEAPASAPAAAGPSDLRSSG